MDIKILKTAIATNSIPTFMIFSGEEQALCKQYINKMSSTLNKYYKYYDTAEEVMVEVDTNLREDFIYIILNDKNINKKYDILNTLMKSGRHVIVYNTEYDSKDSLYKDYKDFFVNFKKLDKHSIAVYLLKTLKDNGIDVDQDKVDALVERCDCNLGYCINEIDKIITLDQKSSNVVFDFMLKHNFPDYRKVNVFTSLQKIIYGDITFLDDYKKLDSNTIGLLTLLYRQAQSKLSTTNNVKLANLMKMCSTLDSGIKDGTVDSESAFDYLLLKFL